MSLFDFIGFISSIALMLIAYMLSKKKYTHTFAIDGQKVFKSLAILMVFISTLRGLHTFKVMTADVAYDLSGVMLYGLTGWVVWKLRRR